MTAAPAIVALMVVTTGAAGQRLTGAAGVSSVEHRVDAGYGLEISRGPLFHAGIRAVITGPWTVGLEGMAGTLSAEGGDASSRDVSELRGTLGFRATSWLRLEAGYGTRMYSAPIGSQRWNSASLAAEGSLSFANERLAGTGRVAWLPIVTVSDLESPDLAFAVAAGVEYRPGAFAFSLSYWLERYDFPAAAGVLRSEQLSGLRLGATLSR